nr:RNA-directed DNA polymerase, eukaryota, reverse transcriptase zinc-binding domain protein [Tanacetum cinerariifolium]
MGGRKFTWMNKVGSKMSKLDRFLISDDVIQDLPNLLALDKMWSDHNPVLLHSKKHNFGLTPFKIFHSWFDRLDFEDTVREKWAVITGDLSGPIKPLHSKLKDLKSHLKVWFSHTKEDELSRRKSIVVELRSLEQKIEDDHATDEEKVIRTNRLKELDDLEKIESIDLAQKARVEWEVDGDENSKFFHCLINSKRKSQTIHGIMHEGIWLNELNDIKEAFVNFYKDKFRFHDSHVSFPFFIHAHHLNTSDRESLEVIDSMDEIRTVVWECGSNKAPGPDDGPFILREIVDWYKKRKKKLMLFKVDFKKAFDSISWKYLYYILDKLGFGIRWCTWIKNCLMSARTSILINGSPSLEFSLRRGLRQGDPLSPFLFIIIMEGLHMALNDGAFPFSYLGLPISSNMSRIASWQTLIDRFKARMSSWRANLLSIGGRLTLIKHFGFKWLKLYMVRKQVWILEAANGMEFRQKLLAQLITFTQVVLFLLTPFTLKLVMARLFDFGRIIGYEMSLFTLDITDCFTLPSVNITLFVIVLLMLHGIGIGVGRLLWKHIDEHFLPSLAPSTRWYKIIPKKLNRMSIPSSHVTHLLQFGALFDLGLVFPSQNLAFVKIGLPGLICGMLLRTKNLRLTPFLLLPVGVFGALESISPLTLNQ